MNNSVTETTYFIGTGVKTNKETLTNTLYKVICRPTIIIMLHLSKINRNHFQETHRNTALTIATGYLIIAQVKHLHAETKIILKSKCTTHRFTFKTINCIMH